MTDLTTIKVIDLPAAATILPGLLTVVSDGLGNTQKATTAQIRDWILNSPILVTPTATTPAPGNNTTAIATTQYVQAALAGLNLGIASAGSFGTVRTNTTDPVPVVYLRSEIDNFNTTPRSVATGGTGAINATNARDNLSAAQRGINGDITSLTALASVPAIVQAAIEAFYRPGFIILTASNNTPVGWLLCDGSAVSRTTFAALFAEIGTTWGIGNGSTTFNLPPSADRSAVGVSGTKALGTIGGNANPVITTANMPSHNHGGLTQGINASTDHFHGASTVNSGTHGHNTDTFSATNTATSGGGVQRLTTGGSGAISIFPSGDHNHTVNIGSADRDMNHAHGVNPQGSGNAFSVQNPFFAGRYLIKT